MIKHIKTEIVFSFPDVCKYAVSKIYFERLVSVREEPIEFLGDNQEELFTLAGMGRFSLRSFDDYSKTIPDQWRNKSGYFLPIYNFEAMAIRIEKHYPMAINIQECDSNKELCESSNVEYFIDSHGDFVSVVQPWLSTPNEKNIYINECIKKTFDCVYQGINITDKNQCIELQITVLPIKTESFNEIINMENKSESHSYQSINDPCFSSNNWEDNSGEKISVYLVTDKAYKKITGYDPDQPAKNNEQYKSWFNLYTGQGETQSPKVKKTFKYFLDKLKVKF